MIPTIKDLRILIVDDSDTTRRILGTIVRSHEWTVCGEVGNGGTGVKQCNELLPDLVLLDFAMPDINGIEVATWMSASNPTVPIIMFTILNLDVFERDARNPGICAVVFKGECLTLLKSIETAGAQFQRSVQYLCLHLST